MNGLPQFSAERSQSGQLVGREEPARDSQRDDPDPRVEAQAAYALRGAPEDYEA